MIIWIVIIASKNINNLINRLLTFCILYFRIISAKNVGFFLHILQRRHTPMVFQRCRLASKRLGRIYTCSQFLHQNSFVTGKMKAPYSFTRFTRLIKFRYAPWSNIIKIILLYFRKNLAIEQHSLKVVRWLLNTASTMNSNWFL